MRGRRSRSVWVIASLWLAACASTLERASQAQATGDDAAAEQLYRQAVRDGKDDAKAARAGLVELLIDRGDEVGKQDPKSAEAIFREVLELDPESTKGRLGLARSLLRQDRQDQALALLDEGGGCDGCGRLLAVLLVERGNQRLRQEQWESARADFEQALENMPDPGAALGVVQTHLGANANVPAVEAMERAVPLIKAENAEVLRLFVAIRRRAVLSAAQSGDLELVDRWFALAPAGAGGDAWFALQVEVAHERVRRGDRDAAIERLARVLERNATEMEAARRGEFERLLVGFYASRAAQLLREGAVAPAENDLTYALRLDPDNWTVKLLRVLAVVALGKLDHGFRMIKQVPAGTEGRKQVLAILWSLRVNERLADGDIPGARAALAEAQQVDPEMPEVHVAAAQLLALTPIEGIDKAAVKELKKRGLVQYPAGHLNRYGEALSELDWARKQTEAMGPRFRYRGASTDARMRSLEQQIRAFYPFEVEFQPDSSAVLVLRAAAGTHAVVVEAPGDFRQEVSVSPQASVRLTLPEPGLTRLKTGAKTVALLTEPYTQLTADL